MKAQLALPGLGCTHALLLRLYLPMVLMTARTALFAPILEALTEGDIEGLTYLLFPPLYANSGRTLKAKCLYSCEFDQGPFHCTTLLTIQRQCIAR